MDENFSPEGYSEPVAQLLNLGEEELRKRNWYDYLALGLGAEHIPDLIRILGDDELYNTDPELDEGWAPLHAWRALGQLRAADAIEPLIGLFQRVDNVDDDWVLEDFPKVFALIGPAALPAVIAYAQDDSNGEWARITASDSIKKIGCNFPEMRDECIAALSNLLERFSENTRDFNALIINSLVDLNAVEAAPLMEKAFAAGMVDFSVQGDWEEVQIQLGLLDRRITPKPSFGWLHNRFTGLPHGKRRIAPPPPAIGKANAKKKKKRQEQKKARKQNRRK